MHAQPRNRSSTPVTRLVLDRSRGRSVRECRVRWQRRARSRGRAMYWTRLQQHMVEHLESAARDNVLTPDELQAWLTFMGLPENNGRLEAKQNGREPGRERGGRYG